ncbi:hypothetical protein [Erysipelatoclostridium ramosum]|uniref:hypothetical protein n=1 Tax=Thomasclavelia ramosa TaxID=1547 RepID=UPI0012E8387C|nr:MAG TPA: hypothetical protein [Caudoviricetes sp.]
MKEEIKALFKDHMLGIPISIKKTSLKWARGSIWHVRTFRKQYTIVEENGHVKTIKDLDKRYFERGD